MTEQREDANFLGYVTGGTEALGYTQQPFDMEQMNRLLATYAALPPLEPIKLTLEQLEEAKALLGPPVTAPTPWSMFTSVPVEIVEDVKDSTPYRLRQEKLQKLAEEYIQVPYPDLFGPTF